MANSFTQVACSAYYTCKLLALEFLSALAGELCGKFINDELSRNLRTRVAFDTTPTPAPPIPLLSNTLLPASKHRARLRLISFLALTPPPLVCQRPSLPLRHSCNVLSCSNIEKVAKFINKVDIYINDFLYLNADPARTLHSD